MFTIKHILNWKLEIELNYLVSDNSKVDWRQVEEEETFESFHDLDDDKVPARLKI